MFKYLSTKLEKNIQPIVGFEAITAVVTKSSVLVLVKVNRRFGGHVAYIFRVED
jgi:hypothetical protein